MSKNGTTISIPAIFGPSFRVLVGDKLECSGDRSSVVRETILRGG